MIKALKKWWRGSRDYGQTYDRYKDQPAQEEPLQEEEQDIDIPEEGFTYECETLNHVSARGGGRLSVKFGVDSDSLLTAMQELQKIAKGTGVELSDAMAEAALEEQLDKIKKDKARPYPYVDLF